MRKCRDCPTMIGNQYILCESCKQIAKEKRKERDKGYWKQYKRKKPSKPEKPPHKCQTCENILTGRKVFCDECAHKRRLRSQSIYDAKKRYMEPPPPPAPTSYDSYHAISRDNAKARESGMSYGMWRANR